MMKQSKTLLVTSAGLLTGGLIIRKFCFNSIPSLKRFVGSFSYTCAGCCITAASTLFFRHTRLKVLSEDYQITALLVSIAGTLGYRYELYCNQGKLMPYNVFWKYLYPWIIFSIFPSVFICGFKNDADFYALQHTSLISAVGILIGISLPGRSYGNNNVRGSQNVKNFISEYTSIFISGVGCGSILSKLAMFFVDYHFQFLTPDVDLFFLGLVMVIFGFIIEDVKTLKEQTENLEEDYEFDHLVTSIPLHIDIILLFLFVHELVEPFYSTVTTVF